MKHQHRIPKIPTRKEGMRHKVAVSLKKRKPFEIERVWHSPVAEHVEMDEMEFYITWS